MQIAMANERDDVTMRDRLRLMHPLVGGQKLRAATPVANQEFSVDELVSSHFLQIEKSGQLSRVGWPVGQGPNPYGSIHQDHQATLLRLGAGVSRRLGTSPA